MVIDSIFFFKLHPMPTINRRQRTLESEYCTQSYLTRDLLRGHNWVLFPIGHSVLNTPFIDLSRLIG